MVLSLAVLNAWMSDLGYSRLTHTTECPFRIDTGASDDKESTVDSNIEAGYLNSVLNAVMSFTALLFMMKFKFDDDNKLEFINIVPPVRNLNKSMSSIYLLWLIRIRLVHLVFYVIISITFFMWCIFLFIYPFIAA